MQRIRTARFGIISGVEPGRVTMDVKSGYRVTTTEGTPYKVDMLTGDEIGEAVINVFTETRAWGEPIIDSDDPITSTEFLASISVDGGQSLEFYPPPTHIRFP